MKKNFFPKLILGTIIVSIVSSCTKNLDRTPINTTIATNVFSNADSTKLALAKVYGAFALTGSTGSGSSDLGGIDAGNSDFLRLYWNAQELPTDESICAWGDPGVSDMNYISWNSSNTILTGLYSRSVYQVTVATSFLKLTANPPANLSAADKQNLVHYRAEARFLRAYQDWVLMDLFANPPFVNDNSPIGSFTAPKQIKRADLFNYVVSELLAINNDLVAPKQNEYARVDQAAAWALLARVYLNAQVYTGTPKFDSAILYSSKVINAGYSLLPKYNKLFLADNNVNNTETILPIAYDGNFSQNYGGTTFLVNGCIDGNTPGGPAAYGVPGGGWGGNRARSPLPMLFGNDYTQSSDSRAKLLVGSVYTITNPSSFGQGIETTKFRNLNSDGSLPLNAGTYSSIDFPLFRLAEQYLIYAEAVLRGGSGGDINTATNYINLLRTRAYGTTSVGQITPSQLTLPFLLDERSRELYIEGFRRTDLVRYGMFTTASYVWPWKGGVLNGKNVDNKYNIYPIPSTDLSVNTNLTQNPGY